MAINTSLTGRLRNTSLPKSRALLPLFEAVVNAIQAVDVNHSSMESAHIDIKILRGEQSSFDYGDELQSLGAAEPITGFIVMDNGEGFHDRNMESFETLDSEYKTASGGRGVGRLLWLKAFNRVEVVSNYIDAGSVMRKREFTFTETLGVSQYPPQASQASETGTEVRLLSFRQLYQQYGPKGARPIAKSILEHCLWYFVRDGGAPYITVSDDVDQVSLNLLYDDYMVSGSARHSFRVKDEYFELIHMRLRTASRPVPQINWCAANRVVFEENLVGKVPGLHGKLKDGAAEFMYAGFVMSPYLDRHVRPERTGFDIPAANDGALDEEDPSMADILEASLKVVEHYLQSSLSDVRKAGEARLRDFVDREAPRYRPVLQHIDEGKLHVDPAISDKDLELQLHRLLAEFEFELLAEGQNVLDAENVGDQEYKDKLQAYLEKVEAIKQSDLAAYVARRRVILDLLKKAIESDGQGKYSKEEVIHNLIIPMGKTSDGVPEEASNLWIIDEGLAFHNYLASDKTIRSMPISGSDSTLEPDLVALQLVETPILVSDGDTLPPEAGLVVVEFKRPMRNDAAAGSDKDPIDQALNYLENIRNGGVMTAKGRPIPRSENIPGFCYIIADLTPTVERCCKRSNLRPTSDYQGYFGYNEPYRAYIEVISFNRLLNMANRRNRAFFDRLGLPIR